MKICGTGVLCQKAANLSQLFKNYPDRSQILIHTDEGNFSQVQEFPGKLP